jgi:hypothetical protein
MRKLHSLSACLPSQGDVDTENGVEVEAACAASTPLSSSILYFLRRRQQVPRPRGGHRGLDHALGRVVGVARSGAQLAVPENGADLVERRTGVRQRRRQAVAEVVDAQGRRS